MRDRCRRIASFRKVVVHPCLQVDVRSVEQVVARDLDELRAVVRALRDRLSIR